MSHDATAVIGIDPGLTRCGVAVVTGPVSRPRVVHAECVTTGADVPLEQRLRTVHDRLRDVIDTHRPDEVAIERVLFSANTRTAMATGQAAGIAMLAGAQADLPVCSYSPTDVKLAVAGSGTASKAAVGRMVAAQLGLAEAPRPADVADAIAVALTHLARTRVDRLAADTPAAFQLQEAHRDARRAASGGWERVLAGRLPERSPRRSAP